MEQAEIQKQLPAQIGPFKFRKIGEYGRNFFDAVYSSDRWKKYDKSHLLESLTSLLVNQEMEYNYVYAPMHGYFIRFLVWPLFFNSPDTMIYGPYYRINTRNGISRTELTVKVFGAEHFSAEYKELFDALQNLSINP